MEFARFGAVLSLAATKELALKRAESFMMNPDRSLLTMHTDVTLMTVLSKVLLIYRRIDEPVSETELKERAATFMAVMRRDRELYDAIITRPRDKFDSVIQRNATEWEQAKAFCKLLLARVGLKQRKTPGQPRGERGVYISNLSFAIEYLQYRYADIPDFLAKIDFSTTEIDGQIERRSSAYTDFNGLDEETARKVWELGQEGLSFDEAVEVAKGGEVW